SGQYRCCRSRHRQSRRWGIDQATSAFPRPGRAQSRPSARPGGVDGGYWPEGVWTRYGQALRAPFGLLHWAGTETASIWNGKLEGALLAAKRATAEVLSPTSSKPDA